MHCLAGPGANQMVNAILSFPDPSRVFRGVILRSIPGKDFGFITCHQPHG